MAKILAVVVVVLLAVCSAEPPRSNRRLRSRSRFFARQELAEEIPTQTPYPPADNPVIAFDLPADQNELFEDQSVISSPDQTYGPPEQTYGTPGTEAVPVQGQEDFGVVSESERFTSNRGNTRFIQQGHQPKAAPLRKAASLQVAPQLKPLQPQILAQPILLADGRIVYSILA